MVRYNSLKIIFLPARATWDPENHPILGEIMVFQVVPGKIISFRRFSSFVFKIWVQLGFIKGVSQAYAQSFKISSCIKFFSVLRGKELYFVVFGKVRCSSTEHLVCCLVIQEFNKQIWKLGNASVSRRLGDSIYRDGNALQVC